MQQLILVLHVLAAGSIIALVLMQHGRGADVGAAFGSGSSNTMFGSSGSVPFLMKLTAVCAAIFFATSLTLSYLATHSIEKEQVLSIPTTQVVMPKKSPEKVNNINEGAAFAPAVNVGQDRKK